MSELILIFAFVSFITNLVLFIILVNKIKKIRRYNEARSISAKIPDEIIFEE